MSPRLFLPLSFFLAAVMVGTPLLVALVVSRPAAPATRAAPPALSRSAPATRPAPPPPAVTPSPRPPQPTSCAALRLAPPPPGADVLLSGFVQRVSRVGFSERALWGVPDGVSYVCLADADHEDFAGALCLFAGRAPAWRRGERVVVRGSYRGVAAVPGTPLLDGCAAGK